MKAVLCYGDSNTYGFDPRNGLRYPSDIRWTGRLQQLLGQNYKVIEGGFTATFGKKDKYYLGIFIVTSFPFP